jgi:hypothetical protein
VEQHVIVATDPVAPVWRREDRVDLAAGEEMHFALVVELAGDREHALDLPGIGGLLECGVTEECTDRGEAQVARLDPDRPAHLEIVEEGADERGVEVGQIEPGGRLAPRSLACRST